MRRFLPILGVLLLPPSVARASLDGEILSRPPVGPVPSGPFWDAPALPDPHPAPLADAAPALACRAAIAAAERALGIPPGLLQAIGLVESGRQIAGQAGPLPWPWSVDFNGSGRFFASKAAAIAAVRTARAGGMRSIDVGCLQVNLMHHPHAFTSLAQAFDPAANAAWAAGFLRRLFAQTHDWTEAAAAYHSQTPALAGPYRARVMQAWAGLGGPHTAPGPQLAAIAPMTPFAPVMPMTLAPPPARGGYRILRAAPPGGVAPPGRGLAAYRARPIPLARGG
ncbi:MAG: transglycosylase SLT domain-containing protein [Acetobacteraceae bacterium]